MENKLTISQNFLTDKSLLGKIIDKINLDKGNLIMDIGAGEGAISEMLLQKGFKVTAFEIDPKYTKILEEKFSTNQSIKILKKDFLSFPLKKELSERSSIFSNIPFNLTTKMVQKILIENANFPEVYLIMQEEAAYRFLGKKEGLLLSLLILNNYETEILHKFKKTDFRPVPKVNIVLMKFIKRQKPLVSKDLYPKFLDFISYIVMQQKPSLIDRLSKTLNYYALKEFLSLLKIEPFRSLYEIPKLKFYEMFELFIKKHNNKFDIFTGSYRNYLYINQKNKKVFQTRTK